jgi:DNA-directed RNA polymerase specialized sigma24 family protein/CheY-like chemotaxis protein
MPLGQDLAGELPYLRRYARALTGSQRLGDAAVRETLEALLEAPDEIDAGARPRTELFRIFHRLWDGRTLASIETATPGAGVIAAIPMMDRQALLLTTVEGFSEEEAAQILGRDAETVRAGIRSALCAISEDLRGTVLVIEDEPIIALHLRSIVEQQGHAVVGNARTHDDAVAMARELRPDLVLADINLADGSSGIDAVNDILAMDDTPVIFVTAYPERLLTGQRPEPTYLITKPFEADTIVAAVGHALLFHREQRVSRAIAA